MAGFSNKEIAEYFKISEDTLRCFPNLRQVIWQLW